jgi:nicotinate-nucleotide adenylyltransferase
MRIAIIGGTFNPIHNGHLYIASEVQWQFSYDLVLFVPAFRPVHKETTEIIDAGHRMQMLHDALSGTGYAVEGCENTIRWRERSPS